MAALAEPVIEFAVTRLLAALGTGLSSSAASIWLKRGPRKPRMPKPLR